jgi:hypothetical protein
MLQPLLLIQVGIPPHAWSVGHEVFRERHNCLNVQPIALGGMKRLLSFMNCCINPFDLSPVRGLIDNSPVQERINRLVTLL